MMLLHTSLNTNVMLKRLSILLAIATILGLVIGFTGCSKSSSGQAGTTSAQKYHCPMHPTYVSDKPGDCPICNMKLVPIKDAKDPAAGKPAVAVKATRYHCPMHPTYTSDKPGDCPICNMKLVPIKEAKPATAGTPEFTCPMHPNVVSNAPGVCPECNMKLVAASGKEGYEMAASESVPGRIAITISPDKQQMIGLTTALVGKRELTLPVRTTATFEHDETRLARIAPRFGGWVRDLRVNFTGQKVDKGQPLFTVYSPELFSAENEYLIGYQRWALLKGNATDPQSEGARRLVESARRKLKLWEIGDAEIQALETNGQPKDELLLRSPVSGHVVAKTAVEGKSFMAGETLYEIADLTHLWLRAYVFEFEAPLIKVGQNARVILPYLGNKTYESKVTFLYPHIEPQTRRAEIRLEVENPELELRPQMWANVELDASFGEVLAVPASAIIDTGPRYIAFVKGEGDELQPREVKVGAKTDDYYQVLHGLKEGDRVVTRALFLVDSESQLKAAISGMGAAGEHNH